MKSCKDCVHYDVCEYWADKTIFFDCHGAMSIN